MAKWYRADLYRVTEVEVIKESATTLTFQTSSGPERATKITQQVRFFTDREEAYRFTRRSLENELKILEQSRLRFQAALDRLNSEEATVTGEADPQP